jgi:hypothetical protein
VNIKEIIQKIINKIQKNLVLILLIVFFLIVVGINILLFLLDSLTDIEIVINEFVSLLAFIILLYTLLEMKEQRKSAYQPTLKLQSHNYIKFEWNNSVDDPVDFSCHLDQKEIDTKLKYDTRIKIFNPGLGSALNLKSSWDFDFNFFMRTLESFNGSRIIYEKDKTGFRAIIIRTFYYNNIQNIDVSDYILPLSEKTDSVYIQIPYLYIDFFALYCVLYLKSEPQITDERITYHDDDHEKKVVNGIPPLTLSLQYSDIGNLRHKKQYLIKPKLIYPQHDELRVVTDYQYILKGMLIDFHVNQINI